VIQKIISDYILDEMIARIIGKDAGLLLNFAAYSIIAEETLIPYKSRNTSEKTFCGGKSYLGAHCEWAYSIESTDTKIFNSFVVTIIRNMIYTLLKEETWLDKSRVT
jgi:hypothetical protein